MATYQPIASPRTALRLYDPSVFADTHALECIVRGPRRNSERTNTHTEFAANSGESCIGVEHYDASGRSEYVRING